MHGQQWDEPNGWAPLQWMAIAGLRRYGEQRVRPEIAHRWLTTVAGLYERESKLVEKYVLHTGLASQSAAAAANIRCRTASDGPTVSCGSCSTCIRRMTPTDAVPDGGGGGCRPEYLRATGSRNELHEPRSTNSKRHPKLADRLCAANGPCMPLDSVDEGSDRRGVPAAGDGDEADVAMDRRMHDGAADHAGEYAAEFSGRNDTPSPAATIVRIQSSRSLR